MKYLVSLIFLFTLNLNAVEVVLQDPQLNEPAPKFSALDSNGKTISLDDFKGQPVILEWTNHECPYVVRHYKEDNMQKVQRIAKAEGYVWLSVISSAPGEQGYITADKANELTISRNAANDFVLLDESGALGMQYGAKTTPHMYMIDAEGILRFKGGIDDIGGGAKFFRASLSDAVNYIAMNDTPVSKSQKPDIQESVPYGCSVKYNYD